MDLRIPLKEKKLDREGDIPVLLEVTVQRGCIMERDTSKEAFGFARDVIGSTRRPNIINKLDVLVLKCIMTPLFIYLDMLALVVPYNFDS